MVATISSRPAVEPLLVATAAVAALALGFGFSPADAVSGQTDRVSVSSTGVEANGPSTHPSISADGRFVAFTSWATNLVDEDTNDRADVFVYDRTTQEIERVSVSSAVPSISADGRFVAFTSGAPNLVDEDTNNRGDVFVYDRTTQEIERVSVSSAGAEANNNSSQPSISAHGRFVAYTSDARNLVAADTNRDSDVFVYDRSTGKTRRVSVSSAGTQGKRDSLLPSMSANGRFVAFTSVRPEPGSYRYERQS